MFEVDPHTADIRLRVRARSLDELFVEAARGLMAVMKPGGAPSREAGSPAYRTTITLDAPDITALLVDFLNEILLICHTRTAAVEPQSVSLRGTSVTAELLVRQVEEFEEDVKAVTYHEADVVQSNGMWSTSLVLDV